MNKVSNYSLVPWFNRNEWYLVYDLIYAGSTTSSRKRKALEILKMWKVRQPLLPAGLEGTLIILQAIEAECLNVAGFSDYDKRVLFSTAVMRFLNICAAYDKCQGTFGRTARRANIPEWIITMRHDIAHSSHLPSTDLLTRACDFALQWLYDEYWVPTSSYITDHVGETCTESSLEEKDQELACFLSLFECLVVYQQPKFGLLQVSDIPVSDSREYILGDLKQFEGLSSLSEKTTLKELANLLVSYISSSLKTVHIEKKKSFVLTLLNGDTFLCDDDIALQLFGDKPVSELPWMFVNPWNDLIQTFQNIGILDVLLHGLFKITHDASATKSHMAALWLAEISKGLTKVKIAQSLQIGDNISTLSKSELKKHLCSKVEQLSPQLRQVLNLNMFGDVPSVVTNIREFQAAALDEPSANTIEFLPYVLELIEPPLSDSSKDRLIALVNTYTNPEMLYPEISNKIYSINDLKEEINECFAGGDNTLTKQVNNANLCSMSEDIQHVLNDNAIDVDEPCNSVWKLAPDIDFNNCALGLLPWQLNEVNPTLPVMDDIV